MRLKDLVQDDHLALKVLTGHDLLDRRVRGSPPPTCPTPPASSSRGSWCSPS
ncbi:hypothetical protein [Nonomuraea recticatena]|uniref:hypothetical protein n=1 Tax=Nonomuraea recticatena TaxID=46178 RepID=UPI00361A18A3